MARRNGFASGDAEATGGTADDQLNIHDHATDCTLRLQVHDVALKGGGQLRAVVDTEESKTYSTTTKDASGPSGRERWRIAMKNLVQNTTIVVLFGLTVGMTTAQPEPFVDFHQGFENGVDGWITDSTPGEEGWCGEIEHRDASGGAVEPSEGQGYAVVRQGACNAYWQEVGFEAGGPYTPGSGYPQTWPDAGYTVEFDVHLDPDAGTEFRVAASVVVLEPEDPASPFRYFLIQVAPDGDGLSVLGQDVREGGWHTLRYTFGDEGGALTVNAELLREGEVLASAPLSTTAYSGEATSSFDVTELGTGYMFFETLGEETELAIDEYRVAAVD
jgi:hypothetical protein